MVTSSTGVSRCRFVNVNGNDLVLTKEPDAGPRQDNDDDVAAERELLRLTDRIPITTGNDDVERNERFLSPITSQLVFEIDVLALSHTDLATADTGIVPPARR